MKIKSDWKGRKDGLDKHTVRYWEDLDEDGYYYELYVLIDKKKACIIVTNEGVSVNFKKSGIHVHTNLVPKNLFRGYDTLVWKQLKSIIRTLEVTELEGRVWSPEEIQELYEEWKRLGEP